MSDETNIVIEVKPWRDGEYLVCVTEGSNTFSKTRVLRCPTRDAAMDTAAQLCDPAVREIHFKCQE